MNEQLWQQAQELAERRYFTVIRREEMGDDESYYEATHPDLSGCRADGKTPEEAKQELAKARVDFIYFLLEDGLPVPEPQTYAVQAKGELLRESTIPHHDYVVEKLPSL